LEVQQDHWKVDPAIHTISYATATGPKLCCQNDERYSS